MNRTAKSKEKRKKDRGERGRFLSGVFVLSASTVLVKMIGLAYKIPMLSYLGTEGMGYFNSAAEIYAMLCVLSTAGLPVALSMLISAECEHQVPDLQARVRRIYRSALGAFLTLGILGSALLFFGAGPLSDGIGNPGAKACFLAISPALFFVCVSGAVRGYFQGYRKMAPTAISQLLEALGKLVFGILFAAWALKKGYDIPTVAAFAVLGLSLGTALSAIYLLLLKGIGKRRSSKAEQGEIRESASSKRTQKREKTLRTLLGIAFPITVSSAVLSVTRIADMALILRRLASVGIGTAEANRIYGAYTTLAIPVFSLIPALVTPVSLSLVPQLTAAIEKKSVSGQKSVVTDAMRLTALLAMPASLGIALYAKPILSLLFSGEEQAVAQAAPLLSILGMSVLFACLITTINAVLQSYRKPYIPIFTMAVGAVVKIVSAWFLIGNPNVGIWGAPISTFFCNFTVTLLGLCFFVRLVPESRGMVRIFYRPLVASVGALGASLAVYLPLLSTGMSEAAAFLPALCVAVVAYLGFAVLTRAITKEDIALIPGVNRFYKGKNKSESMTSEDEEKKGIKQAYDTEYDTGYDAGHG